MTKIIALARKKNLNIRICSLLLCLLFLSSLAGSVYAQTPQEQVYEFGSQPSSRSRINSFVRDTAWYDSETSVCDPIAGPAVEGVEQSRTDNIRTVIGIAKAMNLGQRAALIGLMTAIVESGFRNYANSTIPESTQNPNWLALPQPRPLGNDHDSVGIMQQRVGGSWSSFGSYGAPGNSAEQNRDTVWQLMDPAWASYAFYRAMVQRVPDWRTAPPGVVAQRVQVSAFPERYAQRQREAQSILNTHWPSAPPVPIPFPQGQEEEVPSGEGDNNFAICPVVSGTPQQRILQTIALYAWPDYRRQGTSGALTAKKEYADAIRTARQNGEYIGDTCGRDIFRTDLAGNYVETYVGADCGGFTTRVMRDSGVDPDFNTNPQNNTTYGQWPYLRRAAAEGKYLVVPDSQPLQPGDIAINNGHTYFYVGDGMQNLVPEWRGDSASASQCGRVPMAGPNDTRGNYTWYRFTGGSGSLFTDTHPPINQTKPLSPIASSHLTVAVVQNREREFAIYTHMVT